MKQKIAFVACEPSEIDYFRTSLPNNFFEVLFFDNLKDVPKNIEALSINANIPVRAEWLSELSPVVQLALIMLTWSLRGGGELL